MLCRNWLSYIPQQVSESLLWWIKCIEQCLGIATTGTKRCRCLHILKIEQNTLKMIYWKIERNLGSEKGLATKSRFGFGKKIKVRNNTSEIHAL